MKKNVLLAGLIVAGLLIYFIPFSSETLKQENSQFDFKSLKPEKTSKKSMAEKMEAVEDRLQYEYDMQKNPTTGVIPQEEKEAELNVAIEAKQLALTDLQSRSFSSPYISRGPSNLGGRTRSFAVDISDPSGNTLFAGGVSSGLFRSTDAGASWVKVSANDDIHNVTAVTQDPRPGFQNIWYYGTGEVFGNSASATGAFYAGQGIWQSVDSGLTWNQIPETNSVFEAFDTVFDNINALDVSPLTGDLYVAAFGALLRYDGTTFNTEIQTTQGGPSDVKITSTGRVFASLDGNNATNGVFTAATGIGNYVTIAQNNSPVGYAINGRIVMGIAPSNPNILYTLARSGSSVSFEADLWRYDLSTDTWTDFTSKLPDEAGGDLAGNDPFAIQGGYDLEVSVKPDNENFVVIGGTNVYRINDISIDATFDRIGGYISNFSYGLYDLGGGDDHHPDIHDLVFSPFNNNLLYSGTDGGIHSADVTAATVGWTNLNNNYQTYQYYFVGMDPQAGSNFVIGGAQDNGTTFGGGPDLTGITNNTDMVSVGGGDGVSVGFGRTGTTNDLADIQLYFGSQGGAIRALRDNGTSNIRPSTTNGNNSQSVFVTYFSLDTETNTLYYANGDELFRANEAATVTTTVGVAASPTNWVNIGSLSTGENIRSIAATRGAYSPSSYILLGGQNGGVFRYTNPRNFDFLQVAENITPAGASTGNGTLVSAVAIHPTNPDIAMAVYSNYGINSIFITSNATSTSPTWDLVERNLASFSIRSAAIAEVNGQIGYFVGTARGLYASQDPLTEDWQLEGANTIGLAVVGSLVYRPSDNILLVGTHGNGMYQSDLTQTLSVDDQTLVDNQVKVYPNPTSGPVNITSSGSQLIENISIVDINGKVIRRQTNDGFNSEIQLDVQNLSTGMYFVNITVDSGITTVKKLIVN